MLVSSGSKPGGTALWKSGMSMPRELKRKQSGLGLAEGVAGAFGDAPCAERPEEDADVLDVVAALLAWRGDGCADAADIDFVGGAIEAGVDVERLASSCAGRARSGCERRTWFMYWVSPRIAEELDGVRSPGGGVAGQLFHDQHRALAAAEGDGVGDFGARVVDGGGDASDGLIADEVADVGDDPGRAGLDELVVVELVEVVRRRWRSAPG